jgi:L-alanine-DL-glutamate epimerase-like enolase superfamily enzyme
MKLHFRRLRLDLKFTWAIARGSSTFKENFLVVLKENGVQGYGEAAPNIRYGETPDGIEQLLAELAKDEREPKDWQILIDMGSYPACLQMALNGAWQMYEAKQAGADRFVGLPVLKESYPVTFTLPIMPAKDVPSFFEKYGLARFPYLKVKVGHLTDIEVFAQLGRLYTGPVWIDGNEAFETLQELDQQVAYWQKHVLVAAVEQPFSAHNDHLMAGTKGQFPFPILADESLLKNGDIAQLAQAGFGGINIKLQKAGSHAEAIRQRAEADALDMKVMVGCMVETSLGIWHGLHHADGADCVDLDSMLYLSEEPCGYVTESKGRLHPLPIAQLPALYP